MTDETVRDEPEIMQYFNFMYMRQPLQRVAAQFAEVAEFVVDQLPAGEERDVALRKLLEAKDAAMRSVVALPVKKGSAYVSPFQTGGACCSQGPAVEGEADDVGVVTLQTMNGDTASRTEGGCGCD